MNNESVAWVNERYLNHKDFIEDGEMDATLYRENDLSIQRNYTLIPLYTHPAKTLTDEEIVDLCIKEVAKLIAPVEPDYDPSQWNDTIERAMLRILNVKTILRKAQEK